ncbi:MAG TPA: glycosyl hydrolase family 39 [Bryobacteraceae bacterium]
MRTQPALRFSFLTGVPALCLTLASGLAAAAQNPEATPEQTITIDANAPAHDFPHFWEEMFGSGRAVLSLRADYRKDLSLVKGITGFQYIRFHGIFDRDVGIYSQDAQGNPVYNFSYVDQIYDGLLEHGIRPFVELSFMPKPLAANPKPHPFWYHPIPSPPADPAKWANLIHAFVQHLVDRYGKHEVEQWYFEVWNEPNIDFWDGVPKQATYFRLYNTTARAVKSVDPKLRVGGPATAQAAWVPEFIAYCTKHHVPFDFISTHVYGNDSSENVLGTHEPISQRDMVARAVKKVYQQVRASAAPDTPIIFSEYNATYLTQPEITDSAFMGPWLANNIRECDGLVNMMSYWDFSDVFEEQGIVKKPFYGGYGLVAERNIPKAAFRAFELLHELGNRRLKLADQNALLTKRPDGTLVLALWNYAAPGKTVPPKTFRLVVKNAQVTKYRMRFVDPDHGSSLKAWKQMGSPKYPSVSQIRELIAASHMQPAQEHPISEPVTVASQGLAVLELLP